MTAKPPMRSNGGKCPQVRIHKWTMDSGSTRHATPNRDRFANYRPFKRPREIQVYKRGLVVEGIGMGDIMEQFVDAETGRRVTIRLEDVWHVPAAPRSLLSSSLIDNKGMTIILGNGRCSIYSADGGLIVSTSRTSVNGLYEFECVNESSISSPTAEHALLNQLQHARLSIDGSKATAPMLLHRRFAHISAPTLEATMEHYPESNIRLPDTPGPKAICAPCAQGRMTRTPFKGRRHRTQNIGDLIHGDVITLPTEGIGKKKYWVQFIDDASNHMGGAAITAKDECEGKFNEFWKDLQTRATRLPRLCKVQFDNGGEFISNEFKKKLRSEGIHLQLSTPHTPQQNGKAERTNRTIAERARCMMKQAGIPNRYWPYAFEAANVISNLTKTTTAAIPAYERVHQRRADINRLRVFGCEAYVHIPDENRKKLDKKAQRCIFLGYAKHHKAWIFLDLSSRRIITSRDAIFDESRFPLRENKDAAEAEALSELHQVQDHERRDMAENTSKKLPIATEAEEPSNSSAEPAAEEQKMQSGAADAAEDSQPLPGDEEAEDEHTDQPRRSARSNRGVPPLRLAEEATAIPAHHQEPSATPAEEHRQQQTAEQMLMIDDEPRTIEEARKSPEWPQWRAALKEEFQHHIRNKTFRLAPKYRGRTLDATWCFKKKRDAQGRVYRYKCRWCIRGFRQVAGLDYDETYAAVSQMKSIRAIVSHATVADLEMDQIDIDAAFLTSKIDKRIFVKQPEGFEVKGHETEAAELLASIYGTKQAARCHSQRLTKVMVKELGFSKCRSDECVFFTRKYGDLLFVTVYVDDLVIVGKRAHVDKFKAEFRRHYKIKDLGPLQWILGIKVDRDRKAKTTKMSQGAYLRRVLERFNMTEAAPKSTPAQVGQNLQKPAPITEASSTRERQKDMEERQRMKKVPYLSAIGSLQYLASATRPDIAAAVGTAAQFGSDPRPEHWSSVKRILRYLKSTPDHGIIFGESRSQHCSDIMGWSDSDWGTDKTDRKSRSGFIFELNGGPVSWQSRKQKTVALSTMEAEYIALSDTVSEAIWWQQFLREVGIRETSKTPIKIHVDNQSCIAFATNAGSSGRAKHIDLRHHFVKDMVEENKVKLTHVNSEDNSSDIFTKPLPREQFERLRNKLHMERCVDSSAEQDPIQ